MKRLIALLALAACTQTPQPTLPPQMEDTCGAARYENLIGQDATALERVLILSQVRVIRPDTMITMDFRPERINFRIDDAEIIFRIDCG